MDAGDIISIGRQTVWIIIKTSVPILLVSMIVGLIISLLQTLTSIQEQTLTFVPKLLAITIFDNNPIPVLIADLGNRGAGRPQYPQRYPGIPCLCQFPQSLEKRL